MHFFVFWFCLLAMLGYLGVCIRMARGEGATAKNATWGTFAAAGPVVLMLLLGDRQGLTLLLAYYGTVTLWFVLYVLGGLVRPEPDAGQASPPGDDDERTLE